MTMQEAILRVLAQVQPLLPYLIFVTAATLLALPLVLLLSRNVWVNEGRFRWVSIFFGLRFSDSVRLACAWIKLLVLAAYLVGFRKLEFLHYLLFLVPGLIYVLAPHSLLQSPSRLFWMFLELVGLVSSNLICGYILDMGAGVGFWVVYIMMAVFTALFGGYLFFMELNDISAGRSTDVEGEWNLEKAEDE